MKVRIVESGYHKPCLRKKGITSAIFIAVAESGSKDVLQEDLVLEHGGGLVATERSDRPPVVPRSCLLSDGIEKGLSVPKLHLHNVPPWQFTVKCLLLLSPDIRLRAFSRSSSKTMR